MDKKRQGEIALIVFKYRFLEKGKRSRVTRFFGYKFVDEAAAAGISTKEAQEFVEIIRRELDGMDP